MPETTLDRDRLERLIALGRSLLSELDVEVVLDRVLETARQMTGARFAALGVLDEDRRELSQFVSRGVDEATRRAIGHAPRGLGTLGLLMTDPRPLRIADVGGHPRFSGFPRGHPPMRSFLGVPIVVRGEAWGNLYLADKAAGEFDQGDEDALVVLADWAAIAIENARLYRRVEAAVRGFEATSAIARAVGGETDIDPVLELIVERGRALVDARALVILVREGNELVVAARAGEVDLRDRPRLPMAGSTAGEVLRDGQARRAAGVELDVGGPAATAALLVPLAYRGEGLGVLVALDRLAGDARFTAADEDVLTAFAASAATTVATARTVEPTGCAARSRPPRPSAGAGRASCTTRRCRGSAACRCSCRAPPPPRTRRSRTASSARRSTTSPARSRTCARSSPSCGPRRWTSSACDRR